MCLSFTQIAWRNPVSLGMESQPDWSKFIFFALDFVGMLTEILASQHIGYVYIIHVYTIYMYLWIEGVVQYLAKLLYKWVN